MCLHGPAKRSELKEFKIIREGNHQVGWKVFKQKKSYPSFKPRFYPLHFDNGYKIPKDKWIKEKHFRRFKKMKNLPLGNTNGNYPLGFHIFLTEKDAIRYKGYDWQEWDNKEIVRKVYFRKIVAHGYQDAKIIVAKEMFVLSNKDT